MHLRTDTQVCLSSFIYSQGCWRIAFLCNWGHYIRRLFHQHDENSNVYLIRKKMFISHRKLLKSIKEAFQEALFLMKTNFNQVIIKGFLLLPPLPSNFFFFFGDNRTSSWQCFSVVYWFTCAVSPFFHIMKSFSTHKK